MNPIIIAGSNRTTTLTRSKTKAMIARIKSVARSISDFIKIPARTENRTRPSRYSFLRGLKKVFKSRGTERRLAVYSRICALTLTEPEKKSLYQNTTKK